MIASIRASRASAISGMCSSSGSRSTRRAAGVVEDPLAEQADQAADVAVVGLQRQVERQHGGAGRVVAAVEHPLADRHHALEVGAGGVQPGDDDGARHADLGALVPQLLGGAVEAVGRRDDEQRAVGRAQAGPQLADEVRVAGGVEQVDLDRRRR